MASDLGRLILRALKKKGNLLGFGPQLFSFCISVHSPITVLKQVSLCPQRSIGLASCVAIFPRPALARVRNVKRKTTCGSIKHETKDLEIRKAEKLSILP